jgi:hypothetical protein
MGHVVGQHMTAALTVEVGGFAFDVSTHFWPRSAGGFLLSILISRVMLYVLVFCALIAYSYHIPYCRIVGWVVRSPTDIPSSPPAETCFDLFARLVGLDHFLSLAPGPHSGILVCPFFSFFLRLALSLFLAKLLWFANRSSHLLATHRPPVTSGPTLGPLLGVVVNGSRRLVVHCDSGAL